MDVLLIGRDAESAALDAALADARLVTGGVLVTGPAGIGKTALLRAFAPRCREAGFLTLGCTGLPVGGPDFPYAPVVQLLRELSRHHRDRLDSAVGPQGRTVLVSLAPDVIKGTAPPVPDLPPGMSGARLLSTLAGMFDSLAADGPVAVLVDDLQWVDASTLALLGVLVRGTPASGLLLVVATRVPGLTGPARRWCATERAAGHLATVDLPALTVAETRRLLEEVLGHPVGEPAAAEVHHRSGGIPFLVRELAHVRAGEVPEAVNYLVQAEVDALPAEGARVVAAVAIAGRPVDHGLLSTALGEETVARGAEAALSSGLLLLESGTYSISHDLVRSAVAEHLLPAQARDLHGRLAAALARALSDGADTHGLGEVAWHFERAGDAAATASWALRAAAAAEHAGAFQAAHRHLQRVLAAVDRGEVTLGDAEHVDVLRRAAVAAERSGDHVTALAYDDAALRRVSVKDDPDVAVSLLGHKCGLHMLLHEVSAADAAADLAMRHRFRASDAVRAQLLEQVAEHRGFCARREEALACAAEALAAAQAAGDAQLVTRALVQTGMWRPSHGDQEPAIEVLRQAFHSASESGDVDALTYATMTLGWRLNRLGRFEETLSLSHDALTALRRVAEGRHWLLEEIAGNCLWALFALGRWGEAAALLDESRTAAGSSSAWQRDSVPLAGVLLETATGDLAGAEVDLARVRSADQRRDQPVMGILHLALLQAELRLWQGRPADALAVASECEQLVDEETWQVDGRGLIVRAQRAAADLAVRARDRRDAGAADAAVAAGRHWESLAERMLDESPALRAVSLAERSRLDGPGDPALWQVAADGWGTRLPYDRAYALWRLAQAVLESGGPRSAAEPALSEAAGTCRRLGARTLLAEVESLARRARVHLRDETEAAVMASAGQPGAGGALEGLSPREAEVLRLVAEGRTNRQIGEELFMSPKTASVHVTHLLRKLDVANRIQAAAVAHRLELASEASAAAAAQGGHHEHHDENDQGDDQQQLQHGKSSVSDRSV